MTMHAHSTNFDCPSCGGRTRVLHARGVRPNSSSASIRRARKCFQCLREFETTELLYTSSNPKKLTPEDARTIRATYRPYKHPTRPELARRYGVSRATISSILSRSSFA